MTWAIPSFVPFCSVEGVVAAFALHSPFALSCPSAFDDGCLLRDSLRCLLEKAELSWAWGAPLSTPEAVTVDLDVRNPAVPLAPQ